MEEHKKDNLGTEHNTLEDYRRAYIGEVYKYTLLEEKYA